MKIVSLLILALFFSVSLSAVPNARPEATKKVPPVYTEAILAKRLSGPVVLAFVVEEDGSVTEVKIKQSPAPELSESAIECIKKWRFGPAIKDGAPTRAQMELAILFDPQKG